MEDRFKKTGESKMTDEQYFDYLLNTFDEEHKLTRIVLIGENNAVRLLVLDDKKQWEQNG
jgi:hypothetical protein